MPFRTALTCDPPTSTARTGGAPGSTGYRCSAMGRSVSRAEHLAQGRGKRIRFARIAGFGAEEASVVAREGHGLRSQPLGDGDGTAVRHLALGFRSGADHDARWRHAQRVEVVLVVRGAD